MNPSKAQPLGQGKPKSKIKQNWIKLNPSKSKQHSRENLETEKFKKNWNNPIKAQHNQKEKNVEIYQIESKQDITTQ